MRDMAHSICLIKLYQITMRKNFDFLFLTTLKKRVCLKCWLRPRVKKCGSRIKKCGRGSRNVGHMLQDAGQLEQNAVTHLRLSKMRVAGRECGLRDASCDCQMSRDWGILWRTFVPL